MERTASACETHWVKPALPTTLGDLTWLPVPPTDVILESVSSDSLQDVYTLTLAMQIDVTWVLPGPIDFKKFKHALSLALRDYPHRAGRLSYNEQSKQWRIRLNNEGVPITVGTTEHPGIYSPEFNYERNPGESVLYTIHAPNIRLTVCAPISEFFDSIDESAFERYELNPAPLMKIKLTNFTKTGETTIMILFNHVTGKGPYESPYI